MADDSAIAPGVSPAPSFSTSSRAGGGRSALAPFGYRIFRDVWLANLFSNFGGLIQSVGAAWMMTFLTSSADMVALVQASTALPMMLFSLPAGAISDNFDRRKVMLVSQGIMFTASAVLTAFAYLDLLTPWLLLAFTFLIGCGAALNNPAWQSSVGDMVPRAELPAAITLNSMGFNIARSVGPAVGGFIVAVAGAASAFAVNALSYIALMVVLARWRPETTPRLLAPETLGTAMAAGLRYVAMSPHILNVLARSVVFGLAASGVQSLMPIIARDLVGGGPLTFGILLGAFGIGAVLAAINSARLRARLSPEALMRIAFVGTGLCAAVAGLSMVLPLTLLAMAFGGASWVFAWSSFNTTVQLSSPRWVVGRALALYQVASFAGLAGGAWLWGQVATASGPTAALEFSAAVSFVGAIVGLWFALPQFGQMNLEPLGRWTAPDIAVPITPRSGPIVIEIEYVIDEDDAITFLAIMEERRRIRRRDGARHWVLMRDLADPRLWVERYHSPTWMDYVRQNSRVTKADAVVWERVRALHRGEAPPRVHRMIERQTGALPSATGAPRAGEMAHPTSDPAQQV